MTTSPIASDEMIASAVAAIGTDQLAYNEQGLLQQILVAVANSSGGGGSDNVVTESTTGVTLALTDSGKYIRLTNVASCTITIPTQAIVTWGEGAEISFRVASTGIPTLSNAGVTVNDPRGIVAALETGSNFMLKRVSSDTWDVI